MEEPLSNRSPVKVKVGALLRRLKKADDVARLLPEPFDEQVRERLRALTAIVTRASHEIETVD